MIDLKATHRYLRWIWQRAGEELSPDATEEEQEEAAMELLRDDHIAGLLPLSLDAAQELLGDWLRADRP